MKARLNVFNFVFPTFSFIIKLRIIIIIIIITTTMFMVLSSWHSHCESSPGSFDECTADWAPGAGWPPTLRPNQPIWAVSLKVYYAELAVFFPRLLLPIHIAQIIGGMAELMTDVQLHKESWYFTARRVFLLEDIYSILFRQIGNSSFPICTVFLKNCYLPNNYLTRYVERVHVYSSVTAFFCQVVFCSTFSLW